MRNKFFFSFSILLLVYGCVPPIKSVVDNDALATPFINPLIVIPFENNVTKNFTDILAKRLQEVFLEDQRRVEVITFETSSNKLALNSTTDIKTKINERIAEDQKDVVFVFQPTKLTYQNGMLQTATYIITGTDLRTKKEVWKAEFTSSSSYGPSLFAQKVARTIFEKMKADRLF